MKVENEVFYVFNKKHADELRPLYVTKRNRTDVGILYQQSLICLVEVYRLKTIFSYCEESRIWAYSVVKNNQGS